MLSITMGEDLIDGPVDILRCTWLPVTRFPVAADFDLSNQAGVAIPVIGFPNVHISNMECTGTIETTTTTTIVTTTSTTTLPPPVCGDYDGNGTVSIADALGVLRTSVGLVECELCICDADGNGSNQIGDALRTGPHAKRRFVRLKHSARNVARCVEARRQGASLRDDSASGEEAALESSRSTGVMSA